MKTADDFEIRRGDADRVENPRKKEYYVALAWEARSPLEHPKGAYADVYNGEFQNAVATRVKKLFPDARLQVTRHFTEGRIRFTIHVQKKFERRVDIPGDIWKIFPHTEPDGALESDILDVFREELCSALEKGKAALCRRKARELAEAILAAAEHRAAEELRALEEKVREVRERAFRAEQERVKSLPGERVVCEYSQEMIDLACDPSVTILDNAVLFASGVELPGERD